MVFYILNVISHKFVSVILFCTFAELVTLREQVEILDKDLQKAKNVSYQCF